MAIPLRVGPIRKWRCVSFFITKLGSPTYRAFVILHKMNDILSKNRRDAGITDFPKVLFSEFVLNPSSLVKSNRELSELLQKSESAITRSISVLKEAGYIETYIERGYKRVVSITGLYEPIVPPTITKNRLSHVGFVYIMTDKANGIKKIGFSKNPDAREKTLQSEKPTIEIEKYWWGTMSDEKELHESFSNKRVRGEWFSLYHQDVCAIDFFMTQKYPNGANDLY